jgi:predicted dehydrogenase
MKIGIIGLGSIGKRHVRCLRQLGYEDIIALRTKKGTTKTLPVEFNYITEVFNVADFYSNNLDGVIIANPTALHIETMKMPLEKGIPIFLEKPIADSIEQLKEIDDYDVSKVMVGFNLRYNAIINTVKEVITSGKLGKIYKANLYCGQFLPAWHPYADYRKEYYARKDMGGGVIRTLSHEIDLMHYFLGNPKELCASVEKVSNLEIDVDDNVYMICKMANHSLVSIELDYFNPVLTRRGIIFGSEGTVEYSFSKLNVTFTDYNGKISIIYENINLNLDKMYINQMKNFVNFIKDKKSLRCTFEDGVNVMKVIKAAEESTKLKSWQSIRGGA